MAQHTSAELAPETTFTEDGGMRPLLSVLADPDTRENWILCRPLHQRDALDAVISREGKSPALIAHILSNISEASQFVTFADVEDLLLGLLADPGANAENIHAITLLSESLRLGPALLSKICVHPLAVQREVIATIWHSSGRVAEYVAATTGLLLVAATSWVARQSTTGGRFGGWYPDEGTTDEIIATADAWTTWAGTDPGRATFLATASFHFTCEDELLAAGAALALAPAAT